MYGENEKAWNQIHYRRIDAEAVNRTIKRNLQDDRLPAYGPERQTALMVLMSHAANCANHYLWRNPEHKRTGPPAPGDSAQHPTAQSTETPPPTGHSCCCRTAPARSPRACHATATSTATAPTRYASRTNPGRPPAARQQCNPPQPARTTQPRPPP